MSSLNQCTFLGNLGKDPESRYLDSGDMVTNCSIAVNEVWKDKDTGEKKERVEWVSLVFFKRVAEIAGKYLHKGDKCLVSGRMQTRKWVDKEGNDRWSTEIVVDKLVLLGSSNGQQARAPGEDEEPQSTKPTKGPKAETTQEELDDEVPF